MANVRKLTPELAAKAYTLFNENDACIVDSLNSIKSWLNEQSYLNVRMDDQWLIAFIRGNRYNLENVKKQLITLYTLKSTLSEFKNRDPTVSPIKDLISHGLYLPLENKTDPTGPVFMLFHANYDPRKFNLTLLSKYDFFLTDILLNENDNFTVCGKVMICDMKHVTLSHIRAFTPSFAKRCLNIFFNGYCVNLVATHFINVSASFSIFYNVLQIFLPVYLKDRFFVHRNLEQFYKYVPQVNLPKEYGGKGDSIDELTKKWQIKIESYREWFLDDEKYGCNEELIPKILADKQTKLQIVDTTN